MAAHRGLAGWRGTATAAVALCGTGDMAWVAGEPRLPSVVGAGAGGDGRMASSRCISLTGPACDRSRPIRCAPDDGDGIGKGPMPGRASRCGPAGDSGAVEGKAGSGAVKPKAARDVSCSEADAGSDDIGGAAVCTAPAGEVGVVVGAMTTRKPGAGAGTASAAAAGAAVAGFVAASGRRFWGAWDRPCTAAGCGPGVALRDSVAEGRGVSVSRREVASATASLRGGVAGRPRRPKVTAPPPTARRSSIAMASAVPDHVPAFASALAGLGGPVRRRVRTDAIHAVLATVSGGSVAKAASRRRGTSGTSSGAKRWYTTGSWPG